MLLTINFFVSTLNHKVIISNPNYEYSIDLESYIL